MSKKYTCPYCEKRYERKKLINHVNNQHEDLIPENYTSSRVVFNHINKKDHGICVICKRDTDWNEKIGKYNRLCNNKKCKEKMREDFKRNAEAKHGTYVYTADPKFQEKMLKNRKISSTYTFRDGGKVDYVGSYERKFLEFVDKVMNIESKDILGPGPTIEYTFNGKKRFWITDFYYVPANIVFDIKDGGNNPNKRKMDEYRAKQIAKESAIKDLKKYNYLRLTDNNFSQFMEILTDIKSMNLGLTEKKIITRINESSEIEEMSANTAGVPPVWATDANVIIAQDEYSNETKFALSSLDFNNYILIDDDIDGIKKIHKKEFKDKYKIKEQFSYTKNDKYCKLLESFKNNSDDIYKGIYINLSSFDNVITENQIYYDKLFRKLDTKGIDKDIFNISKRLSMVNNVLHENVNENSTSIEIPCIDKEYTLESVYINDNSYTIVKVDNSVVSVINKFINELTDRDYKDIDDVVNILKDEGVNYER